MTREELELANKGLKTIQITKKGKTNNYIMVNERVKGLRNAIPDATIETEIKELTPEYCVIQARIYEGGALLATGTAHERQSASFINESSYVENCETSAVGRALAFCGIGIDDSMASADELANAILNQNGRRPEPVATIGSVKAGALEALCYEKNVLPETVCARFGKQRLEDLTEEEHLRAVKGLNKS